MTLGIQSIRIQGLRSLADVTLQFDGLTVLIGTNGSGKSSIIEALEILRRVASASQGQLASEFVNIHGGLPNVLRRGASELRFEVRATDTEHPEPLLYSLSLSDAQGYPSINVESLSRGNTILWARRGNSFSPPLANITLDPGRSLLELLTVINLPSVVLDTVRSLRQLLSSIEVHVPFDVGAAWAARASGRKNSMRSSAMLVRTTRVERFSDNLANAYHALKNDFDAATWADVMEDVRLGLGQHIEDIRIATSPQEGYFALLVKLKGLDMPVGISSLSDGQLSYLAFIAMFRLSANRSLLAFDEADLHLHPKTLARVVSLFEREARLHPVVIATQSNELLDLLEDPAKSVRVCELDEHDSSTSLLQLDKTELDKWREDYRGVGELRAHGYLRQIVSAE